MEMSANRPLTPLDDRISRLECRCMCHVGPKSLNFCLSCNRYHLVEDTTARRLSPFVAPTPVYVVRVKA